MAFSMDTYVFRTGVSPVLLSHVVGIQIISFHVSRDMSHKKTEQQQQQSRNPQVSVPEELRLLLCEMK